MSSRYDQPTQEPDLDRYEPKPVDDIDVPDFDAPDPPRLMPSIGVTIPNLSGTGPTGSGFSESIDPAEHAVHTLIEALTTLEQQIVLTQDLQRAAFLRDLLNRVWKYADLVQGKAASRVDDILERRR